MWARHHALLALRTVPTVPAPVVAQRWHGGGCQALLAHLLRGCELEVLDDDRARVSMGALAAKAGASDVVAACVADGALRRHDLVVTSDPDDLKGLAEAVGGHLELERP